MGLEAARIYAVVGADTRGFARGMAGASAGVQGFAGRTRAVLSGVGGFISKWGKRAALGVAAVTVAASGLSLGFQDSMTDIRALVGASDKQMAMYERRVLGMAKTMPQGPKALADALYFVTSSGFEGAAALDVLEQSAKASAAGLGSTAVVADAVTSAVNAYGPKALSAARATDILLATVREGKAEPEELAGAIGRVISPAQTMGVTFEEVGGILASLSLVGLDAAEGVTALRGVLSTIMKPSKQARKFLDEAGESIAGIRTEIKDKGLLPTMQRLADKFKGNQDAIGTLFPNVRALNGFLAATGKNSDKTATAVAGVADSVGDTDRAFEKAMKNSRKRMQRAWSSIQASLIRLGGVVTPVLAGLAERAADVVERVSGFVDDIRGIDGTKARVRFVLSGLGGLAKDMYGTLHDALMGTGQEVLKLDTGKIVEVVPPKEGFLSKWQRGLSSAFDSIDWSGVGESIVGGITSGLSKAKGLTTALIDVATTALVGLNWEKIGQAAGPGLLTALLAAFVTVLDPAFWARNWKLMLLVAWGVLGIVFAPVKVGGLLGKLLLPGFKLAFLLLFKWIPKGLAKLGGAFLRGLISAVAPNASKGAMRVVQQILGVMRALPSLAGALMIQLARVAGEKLGQLAVVGGRIAARFVARLLAPLGSLAGRIGGFLGQAMVKVRGFISQAAAAGASIGRSIIDGIVSAVKGAAGAIKDAVVGIVKGAVDAAKGALKIGSPSKVFKWEVGEPITMGIIQGILAGKVKLKDALVNAVKDAIGEAKAAVQDSVSSIGSLLSGMFQVPPGAAREMDTEIAALRKAVAGATGDEKASLAEDLRMLTRGSLDRILNDIGAKFAAGVINRKQMRKQLNQVLRDAGVNRRSVTSTLGFAQGREFQQLIRMLFRQARKADKGKDAIDGRRASGGHVMAGRTYLVGEHGRELFTAKESGRVHDADDTDRLLSGRGRGALVYVENMTVRDDKDVTLVAAALGRKLALQGL